MSNETIVKFISAVTSVIVSECTRHSFDPSRDHINTFSEKVAAEVATECNEILDDEKEPSPIQQLKIDLLAMFDEVRQEIIEDVREAVRMSLMMELDMELSDIKASIKPPQQPVSSSVSTVPVSKKSPTFEPKPVKFTGTGIMAASKGLKKPDGTSNTSNNQSNQNNRCDPSLENNPLFMRVTQNLERSKQGKNMYSTEDFIAARGDRLDDEHRDIIRNTAKTLKEEFDDDSSEEDIAWSKMDKMMRDRLM